MTMSATARLLSLAAQASATDEPEVLLCLLNEGNALYHQGLGELQNRVAARCDGLSDAQLESEWAATGLPCAFGGDREELVRLLALTEWEATPAAIAYESLAHRCAESGVCFLPETA